MKKLLLASAALVAALGASAANLVVNGDFENPNFVQAVPGDYTWDPWNTQAYLSELPGWVIDTNSAWMGGIEIKRGEEVMGDGDIRPEDDMALAHFVGFNDNGWGDIAMHQIVTGLTAGTEYTLSFLIAASIPEGASWTPEKSCGFKVAEVGKDKEGNDVADAGLVSKNVAADADFELSGDFEVPYEATFTAPADGKVWLSFYLSNTYGTGNKHDNLWMDLDMVSIMTSEEYAGIKTITTAEDAEAPVEYFNLQGVRVAQPENGLYIRRQGNKTTKVVL